MKTGKEMTKIDVVYISFDRTNVILIYHIDFRENSIFLILIIIIDVENNVLLIMMISS